MWVRALTNITGALPKNVAAGEIFEMKDDAVVKDLLRASAVEKLKERPKVNALCEDWLRIALVDMIETLGYVSDDAGELADDIMTLAEGSSEDVQTYREVRRPVWKAIGERKAAIPPDRVEGAEEGDPTPAPSDPADPLSVDDAPSSIEEPEPSAATKATAKPKKQNNAVRG
jgi:hypothetical protein